MASLLWAGRPAWAQNVLPAGSRVCEGRSLSGCIPSGSWPDWVFWVPTSLCSGPEWGLVLNAQISPPTRVFTLFNNNPSRTLVAIGTTGHNIIVGSPWTRDRLVGNGGGDVYVVGNGNAALVSGRTAADAVPVVVSTTSENDQVILAPDLLPDTVYISTDLEITHGANWLNVGGPYPYAQTCAAASPVGAMPWTVPMVTGPRIAALDSGSGLARDGGWPLIGQRLPRPVNTTAVKTTDVCTLTTCFTGVPAVVGLRVDGNQPDRLVLPPDRYLFKGQPLGKRASLPIQVVDGVAVKDGGLIKSGRAGQLPWRGARGIRQPMADGVPLVYFKNSGLLVFSANNEPLGSAANPGQVIAQLLQPDGRPTELPVSGPTPLHRAQFVAFAPFPCPPAQPRSKGRPEQGWCSQLAPRR